MPWSAFKGEGLISLPLLQQKPRPVIGPGNRVAVEEEAVILELEPALEAVELPWLFCRQFTCSVLEVAFAIASTPRKLFRGGCFFSPKARRSEQALPPP